jgi:DNA-directed RNA polymerase subunit RPC12/RpoP
VDKKKKAHAAEAGEPLGLDEDGLLTGGQGMGYAARMPLITCLDCKTEMSDAAIACPRCGRPATRRTFFKRHPILASALRILVMLVIGLVLLALVLRYLAQGV